LLTLQLRTLQVVFKVVLSFLQSCTSGNMNKKLFS